MPVNADTIRTTAAVLTRSGQPLEVVELDLAAPRRDEVQVRLLASGICHSDLSLIDAAWPVPLPMVLGHEGVGVIEAVGPGVPKARLGEHVVLTFTPPCGRCRFCLSGRVNLCTAAAEAFESESTARHPAPGAPARRGEAGARAPGHAPLPAGGDRRGHRRRRIRPGRARGTRPGLNILYY